MWTAHVRNMRHRLFSLRRLTFKKMYFMNQNLALRLNTYNRDTAFYRLDGSCSDVTMLNKNRK